MGCTNTIGSYECSCDEGFVLSFDGHTCAGESLPSSLSFDLLVSLYSESNFTCLNGA